MAERVAFGTAIVALAIAIAAGMSSSSFPEEYWLTVARDAQGNLESRLCEDNWQNCAKKNPAYIFSLNYDGSQADSGETIWNIRNDTTSAMDITFGDFIASTCPVKFNGQACETTRPNVQPGASTDIRATNYQGAAEGTYSFQQKVKIGSAAPVPIDPQLEMDDVNPFQRVIAALIVSALSGALWWFLRRRRLQGA